MFPCNAKEEFEHFRTSLTSLSIHNLFYISNSTEILPKITQLKNDYPKQL